MVFSWKDVPKVAIAQKLQEVHVFQKQASRKHDRLLAVTKYERMDQEMAHTTENAITVVSREEGP